MSRPHSRDTCRSHLGSSDLSDYNMLMISNGRRSPSPIGFKTNWQQQCLVGRGQKLIQTHRVRPVNIGSGYKNVNDRGGQLTLPIPIGFNRDCGHALHLWEPKREWGLGGGAMSSQVQKGGARPVTVSTPTAPAPAVVALASNY